jgi:hypothetical protein
MRNASATMRYHLAILSLLAIGLALCPSSVTASVGKITLKELVDGSDLIVLATVTKIEDGPANLKLGEDVFPPIKIATARVMEVWKGNTGHEVRYVASSTWVCDISNAKIGERVVLFLMTPEDWPKDWPFRLLAHSGRGRMLIRDVEGKAFATIRTHDVRLPKGLMTIPGPETKYEFYRSVELSQLRWTVGAMGRTDILMVGAVAAFALAGLTWFFSSRRHTKAFDFYEEIRAIDDSHPRDVSPETWLRPIAKVAFLVATLLALTILWCHF